MEDHVLVTDSEGGGETDDINIVGFHPWSVCDCKEFYCQEQ